MLIVSKRQKSIVLVLFIYKDPLLLHWVPCCHAVYIFNLSLFFLLHSTVHTTATFAKILFTGSGPSQTSSSLSTLHTRSSTSSSIHVCDDAKNGGRTDDDRDCIIDWMHARCCLWRGGLRAQAVLLRHSKQREIHYTHKQDGGEGEKEARCARGVQKSQRQLQGWREIWVYAKGSFFLLRSTDVYASALNIHVRNLKTPSRFLLSAAMIETP